MAERDPHTTDHAELVFCEQSIDGTHQGELMGIAPTGKRVTVRAFTLQRFSGGKIAEDWAHYDALGMMRQLGAIPEPGQEGGG